MKMKRWYLYVVATICFVGCFVIMNKKYDPFYRVNGINNDNRALIQQYLDDEEQQYLIDNAIAMNKFTKYIASPNFYLPYYEFYNVIDNAKVYNNLDTLVDNTNTLATKLTTAYGQRALGQCQKLISYNLVAAYLHQEVFNMDYIEYYQLVRALYDDVDYSYVVDTNEYITILQQFGITNNDEIFETMQDICDNYDQQSMHLLLTAQLTPQTQRIYIPSELGLVINENTYIASYVPKNLVTATNIRRTYYSIYLQKEAHEALAQMYQAANEACSGSLLLTGGYSSYESISLANGQTSMAAGYNEEQLGTTVHLQKEGYLSEEFASTDMYQWLQENSYKYGYVLRYPLGKEEVTKHGYDSTIYRYVGVDIAKAMHDQGMSLEEYQATKQ